MKLTSLAVLFLLFAAGLAGAAERSREQTFTYSLLTDDAPSRVIMGAKAVTRAPGLTPDVLDVTAVLLEERAATPNMSRQEIDASAWLIRALGAGKQARHRSAIERAVAGYRNDKIGKYAEAALATMTEGDAMRSPVVGLAVLRAQLQAERDSMRGSERRTPPDVAFGTPLETVLAEFGYPHRISETTRTDGVMMVKITQHAMRLDYADLGMVDVGDGTAAGHSWIATRFWPRLAGYTGEYPFEATAVTNGRGRELMGVAIAIESANVREPQLLDIVADRVRTSMGSNESAEVQGLSYLCRLLGASKDRKYAPLLQDVADKGGDNSLRRHAKRGLGEMLDL
jgi:hypothetical protein